MFDCSCCELCSETEGVAFCSAQAVRPKHSRTLKNSKIPFLLLLLRFLLQVSYDFCDVMSNKYTQSHKSQIIYVKQNLGFAVIQKYKLTFQKQIGRKISADKCPYTIAGDKQADDKCNDTANF